MYKDLTNKRFGHQVAVAFKGYNKWRNAMWLCKCDCGNEHIVPSGKLIKGKSTSCGCYRRNLLIERSTKHGLTAGEKPRLFTIWIDMKARCYNPNNIGFHSYGGRGIRICEEWMESFSNFYNWAISNGYSDNLTIDRIDINGNYEPSNCQWITSRENKMKQRKTIWILGKPLSANARVIGISRFKLSAYYHKHGLLKTEEFINKFIHQ